MDVILVILLWTLMLCWVPIFVAASELELLQRFQTCRCARPYVKWCVIFTASFQTSKTQWWSVLYETVVLKSLGFLNSHWLVYSEDSFRKVGADCMGFICSALPGVDINIKI